MLDRDGGGDDIVLDARVLGTETMAVDRGVGVGVVGAMKPCGLTTAWVLARDIGATATAGSFFALEVLSRRGSPHGLFNWASESSRDEILLPDSIVLVCRIAPCPRLEFEQRHPLLQLEANPHYAMIEVHLGPP